MNIVFEGISGSGKTTIINSLTQYLKSKNIPHNYIADLDCNSPLSPILMSMVEQDALLKTNELFNTSLYESLVLAANHHYLQEKHRDNTLNIFDRDFISILAYQKDIIKEDYPHNWQDFYSAFRKIITFQLKNVDLLCYVHTPLSECIARTEKRDHRKTSVQEIIMLQSLKQNMETEISTFRSNNNTPLLLLDGKEEPFTNAKKIINILDKKNHLQAKERQ